MKGRAFESRLNVTAGRLFISELDSTILIGGIDVSEDVYIQTPGSILDANGMEFNAALTAQLNANESQSIAAEAQTIAAVLQAYADRIKTMIDEADAAAQMAQAALDTANLQIADVTAQLAAATDTEYIEELNQVLIVLQNSIAGLETARDSTLIVQAEAHALYDVLWSQAQAEASVAQLTADALQLDANALQAQADALLQAAAAADRTVTAGRDLMLQAGGDIGAIDQGLSIHADGVTALKAGGVISIAGGSDLWIDEITAGDAVQMAMLGTIYAAGGAAMPQITALSLDINTLWFDIGEEENPLFVNVRQLSATGENIYINLSGSLAINRINMRGGTVIETTGDITANGSGVNITAQDLSLKAGGAIGSATEPLTLNVETAAIRGRDIYIAGISRTMTIRSLVGKNVYISVVGDMMGGVIRASSLTIQAFGSVGASEAALRIYVPNRVTISSANGLVFVINSFRRDAMRIDQSFAVLTVLRFRFYLHTDELDVPMNLFIAVGVLDNGEWGILGIWAGLDEGSADRDSANQLVFAQSRIGEQVLAVLSERGAQFEYAYFDGLEEFGFIVIDESAITAAVPCLLVWILNSSCEIAAGDYAALAEDIAKIDAADTLQAAQAAYERFGAVWTDRYPEAVKQLTNAWPVWCENFDANLAIHASGCNVATLIEQTKTAVDAILANGDYWDTVKIDDAALFELPTDVFRGK
jgi:hypothetical protein